MIVPATDPTGTNIFIVYKDDFTKDTKATEFGQTILFRNAKSVDNEGLSVMNYCRETEIHLTRKDRTKLHRVIETQGIRLFEVHRNINFISMSPVRSREKGKHIEHCPCIAIYCSSKGYIPFGEAKFPTHLFSEGSKVVVDVREGFFQFGPHAYATSNSNEFHPKLKMGCQFRVEGMLSSGTIGPFVEFNGGLAFLTCAHNVRGIDPSGYYHDYSQQPLCEQPLYVEQPPSVTFSFSHPPPTYRCGSVAMATFSPQRSSSVDAAVVLVTEQNRIPSRGEFAMDSEIRLKSAGKNAWIYFAI